MKEVVNDQTSILIRWFHIVYTLTEFWFGVIKIAQFHGVTEYFSIYTLYRSVNFEMVFGIVDFIQKTNENKLTLGIIVVKLNSFVRFLEEIDAPKNHFEIKWPLNSNEIHLQLSVGGWMGGRWSKMGKILPT